MPLEVPADATIAQIIEPFGMPPKLVHLVLVNGVFVPPARARHAHAGWRRRRAGHLAAHRRLGLRATSGNPW
jgi:hypothetical protein